MDPQIALTEEVREALIAGAVVGLETNVLAQGLPVDIAMDAAEAIDSSVRRVGAVPAWTWVDRGTLCVGASRSELARLVAERAPKVSTRDLGIALAGRKLGATTVAAALVVADLAGLRVFSSAGIGGVHRGGELSMDVSPDLFQLSRSRLAVVSAGVKCILDIPRTLEVLETLGVPVIVLGADEFPAFTLKASGVPAPHRLDDLGQIAEAVRQHLALSVGGSVLVAEPIAEDHALPGPEVEAAMAQALETAQRAGIHGPGVTRYLMEAIASATEGRSTAANVAVLCSTAATGARLAMLLRQSALKEAS